MVTAPLLISTALDTLKKLRILIKHAIDKGWLKHDPSVGIKRPKSKEIRAWTDAELAAFERQWPVGTKQCTAYALMLNMGAARIDTHLLTWSQVDNDATYTRHKTGVAVEMEVAEDLRKAKGDDAQTRHRHQHRIRQALHCGRIQPLHA